MKRVKDKEERFEREYKQHLIEAVVFAKDLLAEVKTRNYGVPEVMMHNEIFRVALEGYAMSAEEFRRRME